MKKILYKYLIGFLFTSLIGCGEAPESDFTWSPETPKAGEAVQFTNLSRNAKRYSWNLGNMNISKEENPETVYETPGDYMVDLVASKGARSDEKTVTITVIP